MWLDENLDLNFAKRDVLNKYILAKFFVLFCFLESIHFQMETLFAFVLKRLAMNLTGLNCNSS